MKMTIVLLVALGLVAAICAVLLINALDIAGIRSAGNKAEVSVVKVTQSLPAMTILTEDVLQSEKGKLKEMPQGYFTSPTQVIGKVLSVPMVEGQMLTSDKIVRGGSSAELAATLPIGMRAVSVNLSGSQISGGMIYPGCMVDVLVAFSMGATAKKARPCLPRCSRRSRFWRFRENRSFPSRILRRIKMPKSARSSRGATVTLMVDTNQAEALQLAAMNGKISVTLRNPLDNLPQPDDATVLNRGKLGRLGSLMGTTVKSKQGDPADQDNTSGQSFSSLLGGEDQQDESDSSSEVMVIRGSKISYNEVESTQESQEAITKQ